MPAASNRKLPWKSNTAPLMLAPMQGLTNRELRDLYIDWVRPDVVFSEFIRVAGGKRQTLRPAALKDVAPHPGGVPLVVQLIGCQQELLAAAAKTLQDAGVEHINLNLGCPFGRTTSSAIGGELLRHPGQLPPLLNALRNAVSGSFSVKLRAGYDQPGQLFDLLPVLADAGVDFLILHPRTVTQQFKGHADHTITAAAVKYSPLPIVANGDINTATQGRKVLGSTGAVGLMLGRGALADPLLFQRLRDQAPALPSATELRKTAIGLLRGLLPRYQARYCGKTQVLSKLRCLLPYIQPAKSESLWTDLQRAKTLDAFATTLDHLEKL
ncbi:MAG: tRNA-dihydrouridine synthase family protein [Syntrophotaleaceae bacterium]